MVMVVVLGWSATAATGDPKALDWVTPLFSPCRGLCTDWWDTWPAPTATAGATATPPTRPCPPTRPAPPKAPGPETRPCPPTRPACPPTRPRLATGAAVAAATRATTEVKAFILL